MPSRAIESPIPARKARLRFNLAGRELDYLIVTSAASVFYLSGFRGSAGVAAIGRDEGVLFVDPRYTLQAREQARGVQVREVKRHLLRGVGSWLRRRGAARVGFDDGHLTCAAHRALADAAGRRCRLCPAAGMVEDLRLVKDETEVALIKKAGHLTSRVFEEVRRLVRPGVSEAELAAEIDYRLRRKGAEGVAFETIVASGKRSAYPHARASSKLLKKNELVVFDLGAIICGYAADMTRTISLGMPGVSARRMYKAVLSAQEQAISAVRAGQRAGAIDGVARRALASQGLGRFFTHSTGHGLGLEIHEKPRLGRNEKQMLPAGCVITVEPGVYVEGVGGVRIEDTVLVTENGPEVLTTASKQDWIIP